MLWLKAFHIVAVVTWFAGLFYLPRLLVYHAEATEPVVRERFKIMERRLLAMTRLGSTLTVMGTLADYTWNPETYDATRSGASWSELLKH